jgi:hypothetical protein
MGSINDFAKTWTGSSTVGSQSGFIVSGIRSGITADTIDNDISSMVDKMSFVKKKDSIKVRMEFEDMKEDVKTGFERIYGNKE